MSGAAGKTEFIDMHCDTLTMANFHFQHDIHRLLLEQIDIEKLQRGGARAQFFAICLPKITTVRKLGRLYEGDWKHIRRLAGILRHTCDLHGDRIAMLHKPEDLEKNMRKNVVSAVLTIEDGRDLNGDLGRVRLYHRLGVRLITLTWNFPNSLGYPASPAGRRPTRTEMEKGLTAFGKEAVGEMNRLGIIIDVSHLSDGGIRDVAALTKKPFAASHSNCRALCRHPRNLSDELIRLIASKGGVIGLNQYPGFLDEAACNPGDIRAERLRDACVEHLKHLRDVGGIDCCALGSDFDGFERKYDLWMKGPQDYPKLQDVLLKSGFTSGETEKIFYRNAARVMRDAM